tara:strand:- start:2563 stop:3066 length:504 start_codon:yes stop_codon:yes gene_type:complete
MKIEYSRKNDGFFIKNGSKNILLLKYENLFSSKANTNYKNTKISIKPKNIWCSKFDIYKNEEDVGDIISNWQGNIIIRNSFKGETEKSYLLEAKGFWKQKFELINESKKLILVMEPKMRSPGFDYKIDTSNNTLSEDELIELLIYCGFGANLYMQMMSASLGFAAGI